MTMTMILIAPGTMMVKVRETWAKRPGTYTTPSAGRATSPSTVHRVKWRMRRRPIHRQPWGKTPRRSRAGVELIVHFKADLVTLMSLLNNHLQDMVVIGTTHLQVRPQQQHLWMCKYNYNRLVSMVTITIVHPVATVMLD